MVLTIGSHPGDEINCMKALTLAKGEVISIYAVRSIQIEVLKGQVWLTAENDTRDFFPKGGQTVSVIKTRLMVIEAMESTDLLLVATPRRKVPLSGPIRPAQL